MPVDGAVGHRLLPELGRIPGHLLWRAAARVSLVVQQHLPAGLDVHAYAVLLALGRGGARSQQDLADAVGVSRTTLTKVATGLVEDGLVERVRNPDDRRSYLLTRTEAGATAERRWRRHVDSLEAALAPGMDAAHRERLRVLLQRVVEPLLSDAVAEPVRRSLGFLVTKAHVAAHREALAALRPWGLEPRLLGSTTVLEVLGPVPQATLAEAIGVTPASTVQIVDDLERLGLVRRERDRADRRTQLLHLSEDGADVLVPARRAASGSIAALFAPLDDAETAELTALLRELVTSG